MNRVLLSILCLIVVSSSVSAQTPRDKLGSSPEKIQGGVPDQNSAPVGLLVSEWEEDGESAIGFCTGTLITPWVVLTAGHCVSEHPVKAFFLGDGVPVSRIDSSDDFIDSLESRMMRIPVNDQLAFPGFNGGLACPSKTSDVGLVRLARPVETIAPAKLDFNLPQIGDVCQAVGYGEYQNQNGKITLGEKRMGDDIVKNIGPLSIRVMYLTALADHGDSGGPLYCNGTVRALCSCGNRDWPDGINAYYSRIDTVADWINSIIDDWD